MTHGVKMKEIPGWPLQKNFGQARDPEAFFRECQQVANVGLVKAQSFQFGGPSPAGRLRCPSSTR